jgi:hypothetical protein
MDRRQIGMITIGLSQTKTPNVRNGSKADSRRLMAGMGGKRSFHVAIAVAACGRVLRD